MEKYPDQNEQYLTEILPPIEKTGEGYVRWYRSFGQNTEITKPTADMLFEYGTEVIRKVYTGKVRSPYLSRKENQPLLLDAANMLMEATENGAEDFDSAAQGASVLLESIVNDETYESSVRLDAAMYRGDLEFIKLHAQGEYDEVEWETAHSKSISYILSAINACAHSEGAIDANRLPVGKMFEIYSLVAARHNLLKNQDMEQNMFNTHFRASYLREDRGHTNNRGQRPSANFDMAHTELTEQGWKVADKWQFGVEKSKTEYASDIITISYEPEEGTTAFVDNIISYLHAFSKEARYISLLNEMPDEKINPHLKPTKKDEHLSEEGIERYYEALAA